MNLSKKNVRKIEIIALGVIILFDKILPLALKYVFPQFAFYFKNQATGNIDKLQLLHMGLYIVFFIISMIINFWIPRKSRTDDENKNSLSSFLFSTAILSIMFRYLGIKTYIFSRMGFYFYMFSYSIFVQSIEQLEGTKIRTFAKLCTCFGMTLFFFMLIKSLKLSYGVDPYYFFWE